MSTGLLIALIVVAVIVAILVLTSARKAQARRDEGRRLEAREHREEAEIRGARADAQEAEAMERAARAQREQAQAEEQAALARKERRAAEERLEQANRLDPDVDHRDVGRGSDRDHAVEQGDDRVRYEREDRSQHDVRAGDPSSDEEQDRGTMAGRHGENGSGSVSEDPRSRR